MPQGVSLFFVLALEPASYIEVMGVLGPLAERYWKEVRQAA